jgi:hypothetical protein
MPKIQTSCPQCKGPIIADVFQVIDVSKNPDLKELLLAGGLNIVRCPVCGFQGQLPVPMVYHDAEKELLLTFTPPDLTKTMEEKESSLAPLLKTVIDNLKPEERKGYLFQPQAMLTMNNLVKNVLLGDGITEEMIQEQQEKLRLLDQLFTKDGDQLKKAIQENDQKIDREFFSLFAEIAQRILAANDEKSIKRIQEIQNFLLNETEIGREINRETQEIQEARKSLEALGQNLTRESLLELVVKAPSMERIRALAGLVRPAMDYEFFQKFTEKIERTADEIRNQLVEKRNQLLKFTQEIDSRLAERINEKRTIVEKIIASGDPKQELIRQLSEVDQFFLQALSAELEMAEKDKNEDKKARLESLLNNIKEITTPPELELMNSLLEVADDPEKLAKALDEDDSLVNSQLIDYMTAIISQYNERIQGENEEQRKELEDQLEKIKKAYNAVLKKAMKLKMEGK